MQTSDNGRKFIENYEGCILQAYDDHNDHIVVVGKRPLGVLTIGYGHTSAAGAPQVYVDMKITQEQADEFLSSDLHSVELSVAHLVEVALTQNQFDALVSFQYNTGALHNSTLLKLLNQGKYVEAADQFLIWNHVGKHVSKGLTIRRKAEREMFLKHEEPIHDISIAPDAPKSVLGIVLMSAWDWLFLNERKNH